MQYDNGEVIQGLDETWTFMGGTVLEWGAGLVVFFIISLFAESPSRAMPFMLMGWIVTVTSLASVRHLHPDQERGVRNAVMTSCGFPPPGIPKPAKLQPVWSGCPILEMPRNKRFMKLGLDHLFPKYDPTEEVEDFKKPKHLTLRGSNGNSSSI